MADRHVENGADAEREDQRMVEKGRAHLLPVAGKKDLAGGKRGVAHRDFVEGLAAADRISRLVTGIDALHRAGALDVGEDRKQAPADGFLANARERAIKDARIGAVGDKRGKLADVGESESARLV